jgi:hypothetical protein
VLVYHARDYRDIVGDPLYDPNRHTRIQRLNWNPDGTPDLGVPHGGAGPITPAPPPGCRARWGRGRPRGHPRRAAAQSDERGRAGGGASGSPSPSSAGGGFSTGPSASVPRAGGSGRRTFRAAARAARVKPITAVTKSKADVASGSHDHMI